MPDVDKVKRNVRAVLLSSKHGCSPRQLLNDYKHLMGECLPFESLGYASLMDFVFHIPDVVSVIRTSEGVLLRGVADQSTQHIARMVRSQKSSKMPSRRQLAAYSSPSLPPPRAPVRPQLPHTFKIKVKTLLLSYPSGIQLQDFSEAFARRFNYYFSVQQFGFRSTEELLKSMPDVVQLAVDRTRNTITIRQAASGGGGGGINRPVSTPITSVVKARSFSTSTSSEVSRNALTGAPPSTTTSSSSSSSAVAVAAAGGGVVKPKPLDLQASKPPLVDSLHSLELSPTRRTLSEAASSPSSPSKQQQPPPLKLVPEVPGRVVQNVRRLLEGNTAGLWLSRFPDEYKAKFKEELPMSSLGFTSVVHLLSYVPVCDIHRPSGTGDWLVYLKGQKEPPVAVNHLVADTATFISPELARKIQLLLSKHTPDGIQLVKFPAEFKRTYSEELPVEEIGFKSVAELLKQVPKVTAVKPVGLSCIMVLLEGTMAEELESDSKLTPITLKPISKKKVVSSFTHQQGPQPTGSSEMIPVYVTHIDSPSCFSVQLIKENTTQRLECLQNDMAAFFRSKEAEKYRIEEPMVGQACVTVFSNDGYWYRAEVTDLPAHDIAIVKYVDYGNSGQVACGALRRAKPNYLALPAQAIQCRLANLKPAGSTWSPKANKLLHEMTKDKALIAIITANQNNFLSVCLCDTTTSRDLHINDTLVSQGVAIFDVDTVEDQTTPISYLPSPPSSQQSPGDVPKVRLPEALPVQAITFPPQLHPAATAIASRGNQLPTSSSSSSSSSPSKPSMYAPAASSHVLLNKEQQASIAVPPSTNTTEGRGGDLTSFSPQQLSQLQQQLLFKFLVESQGLSPSSSSSSSAAGISGQTCSVTGGSSGGDVVAMTTVNVTENGVGTESEARSSLPSAAPAKKKSYPPPGLLPPPPLPQSLSHSTPPRPSSLLGSGSDSSSVKTTDSFPVVAASSPKVAARPVARSTTATTAATRASSSESGSRSECDGRRLPSSSSSSRTRRKPAPNDLLYIKKVVLTESHDLHVIRYQDQPHFVSGEVSDWFWEDDLLQSMLRQIQKPVWGRVIQEKRLRQLFCCIRKSAVSAYLVRPYEATVYSLNELPLIVSSYQGPPELLAAVRREVDRWNKLGLRYFSVQFEQEMEQLNDSLKELHLRRKEVLLAMVEKSDGSLGQAPIEQLIDIEKDIADTHIRLVKMVSSDGEDEECAEGDQTSCHGSHEQDRTTHDCAVLGEGGEGVKPQSDKVARLLKEISSSDSCSSLSTLHDEEDSEVEKLSASSATRHYDSSSKGQGGSVQLLSALYYEDDIVSPSSDPPESSSSSAEGGSDSSRPSQGGEGEGEGEVISARSASLAAVSGSVMSQTEPRPSQTGNVSPLKSPSLSLNVDAAVFTPVPLPVSASPDQTTSPLPHDSNLPFSPNPNQSSKPLASPSQEAIQVIDMKSTHPTRSSRNKKAPPGFSRQGSGKTTPPVTVRSQSAFGAPINAHPQSLHHNARSFGPQAVSIVPFHPTMAYYQQPSPQTFQSVPLHSRGGGGGYYVSTPSAHHQQQQQQQHGVWVGVGLGRGGPMDREFQLTPGPPQQPTPAAAAASGEWQYVSHHRRGGAYDHAFPPLGSSAGLDII